MSQKQEKISTRPWWLNVNMIGVLLVVAAFIVSMYRVSQIGQQLSEADGTTILRVSHWQLELGYRDALDDVIKIYEKEQAALGKKVRVLQMPVTEKFYAPWLNTSLISGQAPDIISVGMSKLVYNEQYLARYFIPLTQEINKPNPYNKGNELENVPWRETIFDGMRGQYNVRLQDYFTIPTTAFNIRIFYNKTMLKAATGSDAAPRSFGQLLEACRKLDEYGQSRNRKIIPIAGSQYSVGMFTSKYAVAFTANLEKQLDLDLDGIIKDQEMYIGYINGIYSLDQPNVRAYYDAMRELCQQFGPGFAGKDRATAAFEFVQQRAGMIATGSWDAQSIFKQADAAGFEVGIFDFPLPAPGEKYSEYVIGKPTEAASGSSGGYGLYKFSRHHEQALDFLQFLSSKRINQLQMQKTNWIPVILGTEPTGRMAAFASDPIGFTSSVVPSYGSDIDNKYRGELQSFLQGSESYEVMVKEIDKVMRDPRNGGDSAWLLEYTDQVKQTRNQERALASQVVRGLMLGANDWSEKHRQILLQQVNTNNGMTMHNRFQQLRHITLEDVDKARGG